MRITQMANFLTLVVICLWVAAFARSDSAITDPPLDIAYLGRLSAAEDSVFRNFQAELNKLPTSLRARLRVHHLAALTHAGDRIEDAVTKALAMRPALIVAPSSATALVVRARGSSIPVVFTSFSDPVRNNLVTSTGSRSEPFAGVWMADDLDEKRLEILRDAYPEVKNVAVLMDRIWERNTDAAKTLPVFARRLGLHVTVLLADDLRDALALMDTPEAKAFDAWCIPPSGLANLSGEALLQRVGRWRKPLIMGYVRDAERGAPLSYALDNSFRWPAMVDLIARVLQGEPAGAIPIQRPYRTILAVRPLPEQASPAPSSLIVQRADLVYR